LRFLGHNPEHNLLWAIRATSGGLRNRSITPQIQLPGKGGNRKC